MAGTFFDGKNCFVDPRREFSVADEDKNISVQVDSQSQFASSLRQVGKLEAWKKIYELAKKSSVARIMVAAADVNDFAFLVDEKQVADSKLKEQFDTLVYALANSIGRPKINKDSTLRKTQDWWTIVVMTGETQLLADNVTGGATTRLLNINAPKEILDANTCKELLSAIKGNYGLAFPPVI